MLLNVPFQVTRMLISDFEALRLVLELRGRRRVACSGCPSPQEPLLCAPGTQHYGAAHGSAIATWSTPLSRRDLHGL
jgi:hypothetical protein